MPANTRLRFSINHYLCGPQMTLPSFLDVVERAGFDSVGLTQRALDELPLPALRHALAARGLSVCSINSAGFLLGEPADRQDARNRRLVDATAELGAAVLNVLPGRDPDLSVDQSRTVVADRFAALAAVAERAGVHLALEPLHATHARTRSCINTIADAAPLIERATGTRLTFDLFHLQQDGERDATADGKGPPLGLVQICDIAIVDGRPGRLPLDEGGVDWRGFVRRVQAAQPRVPIELELFADQLPDRSATDIIAATAVAMRS
jgi:sugar phosphate isomerase/epimerase